MLLDEAGRVYLADFGIARMVERATIVTQKGAITGTPHYMAPEQVSGDPLDGRCDVYALGIITYELLTGHVPFSADTPVAVLMKHASEPIPLEPLANVPEPLMPAVLKAVAKKPADRWASAGDFDMGVLTPILLVFCEHRRADAVVLPYCSRPPPAPNVCLPLDDAPQRRVEPKRPTGAPGGGMMKIKAIAACILLTGVADAQGTPSVPKSAPTKIFAGAKIFIESEGEFAMALGASFIEKKVPVTVVAQPEKADFILKATSQDRKASTAGKVFGVARDRYYGTVSVFNKDGDLVFAYNVKKGTFQDAANSTANEIKSKQIEGR